ncbi:MAG: SDH family Clp fold serine proteinase, partial [bacterium]
VIDDLELDQGLQDAVLSVFHATTHTFNGTPAVKLIENHHGRAYIQQAQQQVVMVGQPPANVPPPAAPPGPP